MRNVEFLPENSSLEELHAMTLLRDACGDHVIPDENGSDTYDILYNAYIQVVRSFCNRYKHLTRENAG